MLTHFRYYVIFNIVVWHNYHDIKFIINLYIVFEYLNSMRLCILMYDNHFDIYIYIYIYTYILIIIFNLYIYIYIYI